MSTTTPKPAGSRRFWVTVLCFTLANAAVWIGYDRLQAHRRHALLEVEQSAPSDAAEVSGRPIFWWTFNLDAAPSQPNDPPPGEISPSVSGKWVWDNPRTLSFTPDAPLPRATAFTVKLLPERLRTPEGFHLNKSRVTSVHTAPLRVTNVFQAALDEQDRAVLEIEFNDEVIPTEAMQHLTLKTDEGKPLGFHQYTETTGKTLWVMTDTLALPKAGKSDRFVKVELSPGFSGRSGPLGLEFPYSQNVSVDSELAAIGAESYFAQKGEVILSLRFNNSVEPGAVASLISVEPKIPFTLAREGESLQLHGGFQPATRYAIKIAAAPKGTLRSNRPRPDTLSVFVPDRPPSVWFEHDQGYLGSAGNRTILAHAVNLSDLRASVTRIYDNNLVAWKNSEAGVSSFDRPIVTHPIKLPAKKNSTQDIRLSLDDLLPPGTSRDGVFQIRLEAASSGGDEDYQGRRQDSAIVTLSDIALTAKKGRTRVTVWATSLRTAQPLGEAMTSSNGLASITPAAVAEGEEPAIVLADRPDASADAIAAPASASNARDLTWLHLRAGRVSFGESETTGADYLRTGYEAFIYTDRGVYRPGETVHLRAIVRGPDGDLPQSFPVRWQFRRPDLHDWKAINSQIDPDGAVSLDLPLPDDLPTGQWSVVLGLPGKQESSATFGDANFQVEDFMPNRIQVGLKLEGTASAPPDNTRFMVKDHPLTAHVQADYLFGKPVSERPARLVARIDPATFTPAKWEQWTFGDAASTAQTLEGSNNAGRRDELPEQSLDAGGQASFDLDLSGLIAGSEGTATSEKPKSRKHQRGGIAPAVAPAKPGSSYVGPWRLTLTASVIETGGRAVSATREAELDPIDRYVGLRASSAAVSLDSPAKFDAALVAPSGDVAADDCDLQAMLYRETWNNSLAFENGHFVYHSTRLLDPVGAKQVIHVTGGKGLIAVRPDAYGSYVLRVIDPQTGFISSISFYAGGGAWEDNISRENPEKLELLVRPLPQATALLRSIRDMDLHGALAVLANPNAAAGGTASLRAGDFAQVIVRSPFAGRLLLSMETDDVVTTRVIEMPQSHMAIPIRISGKCRPNTYVTATVIRAVDPNAAWQVHRAIGTLRIPLDNTDRKLNVEVASALEIRPSTSLNVAVRITDSHGAPAANAAVTVAAVDEGICQLTGFKTPDPFSYFTRNRALGVATADLFSDLMPETAKPEKTSAIGGDKDSYDPRHLSPVSAKRVKPVALMSAVVHTDSNGFASIGFNVPQFTGKLRLMAVASEGASSGSGEAATLVRSPLLVQSSWPRFAAPQDRFLVPLVIFNNSPAEGVAQLSIHISDGPLRVKNGRDASLGAIKLAPNGQATQLVEVSVEKDTGVSHVALTATMGNETYQEDLEIPVRPASPSITLGGYAVATPDKPIEISLPGKMLKGTEQLHIQVATWPQLQLPQGLDYLERYPYGCLEQTTSTLFPLAYLSDIGGEIAPGVFEKQRVEDKIQSGITHLIGMQTANGGLAMWPAYREPWPWGSVYAAHFLIEAGNAGHPVPEEFQQQLLSYVRSLLNQSSDDSDVVETQAYACYVLALAGKPERAVMNRLMEVVNTPRGDRVDETGQARLLLATAWLAGGRRDLAESLIPQTLPVPRQTRSLSGSIGSPIRDRAILINTLLAVQPDHPALPALVQQLADSGLQRQWRSTQDTAFAVLAIGRYLRQFKSSVPYDSAELAMGDTVLAKAADRKNLLWDAGKDSAAPPENDAKVRLSVTGKSGAKAHLSWLQVGVPLDPPSASDHGMKIRRRFLDEKGKPLDTNRVHSGDLVQVELSISSATPLHHIVIDDLLPAGLEIENPRLKTTAAQSVDPADPNTVSKFHDARVDMRDDRIIVVGDLEADGTGTYVYTARAVTPGTFVLPPVHGECMYDIATNSLSGNGTFQVLPAGSPRIANIQE